MSLMILTIMILSEMNPLVRKKLMDPSFSRYLEEKAKCNLSEISQLAHVKEINNFN